MEILDDTSMINIRELIDAQDAALRLAAAQHQLSNPGHVVTLYNNFIQCNQCDYHEHVSGLYIVQHNAKSVIGRKEVM